MSKKATEQEIREYLKDSEVKSYMCKRQAEIDCLVEAKKDGWTFKSFNRKVYHYRTKDNCCYLVKTGDEKPIYHSTDHYRCHLVINNKDVLKDKKAVFCLYYGQGNYTYKNVFNEWFLIVGGKNQLEGLNINRLICNYDGTSFFYQNKKIMKKIKSENQYIEINRFLSWVIF